MAMQDLEAVAMGRRWHGGRRVYTVLVRGEQSEYSVEVAHAATRLLPYSAHRVGPKPRSVRHAGSDGLTERLYAVAMAAIEVA